MRASVETSPDSFEALEMGAPECGEDFCEQCGDCMACSDDCYNYETEEVGGSHSWVIYEAWTLERLAERLAIAKRLV